MLWFVCYLRWRWCQLRPSTADELCSARRKATTSATCAWRGSCATLQSGWRLKRRIAATRGESECCSQCACVCSPPTTPAHSVAWLSNRTLHGAHEDTDLTLLYRASDGTAHAVDAFSAGAGTCARGYGFCIAPDRALGGEDNVRLRCAGPAPGTGRLFAIHCAQLQLIAHGWY